jgi:hypothetical protein
MLANGDVGSTIGNGGIDGRMDGRTEAVVEWLVKSEKDNRVID